ncbi:MAG: division/cell wall cluster transcriptional repressor MraZ [Chloroflexota bacterium]
MFVGESTQKLDAKFRMTMPPQHRRFLEDGMMITRGIFDQCLLVFTLSEWESRAAKIESLERLDRKARQLRRQFFTRAERVSMDSQGRILISQRLREFADIDSEAIVAGNHTFLEIWSPGVWDQNAVDELDIGALDEVDERILDLF